MAERMSNRDRIARAAQEAEAASKEKAAADGKPKKAKRAKRASAAKPTSRTRIVWAVCDQTGATVETYAYPKEDEARAEAERLTEEKGKAHFVKRDEVPFE